MAARTHRLNFLLPDMSVNVHAFLNNFPQIYSYTANFTPFLDEALLYPVSIFVKTMIHIKLVHEHSIRNQKNEIFTINGAIYPPFFITFPVQ